MTRGARVLKPRGIRLFSRALDAFIISSIFIAIHFAYGSPFGEVQLAITAIAILVFHLISEATGLYLSDRRDELRSDVKKILTAWLLVIPALLLSAFLAKKTDELSRVSTSVWFLVTPVVLIAARVIIRSLLGALRRTGRYQKSTVILGATPLGATLIREIESAPWLGMNVLGVYDDRVPERCDRECADAAPILGGLNKLVEEARRGTIDLVYIALPLRAEPRILRMIDALSDTTASVYLATDFESFDLLHATWSSVGGTPVVSIHETPFYGVDGWLKRLEDLVLGSIILSLIAVPMLFIAIAIKCTSRGPVFFRQRRYGLNGEVIYVLKFRSMRVAEDGPLVKQAEADDPRVTPLGRFLRRTSLDELPQFFHVITGKMSIVGPRPHAVAHNEAYRRKIRRYMLRHKVKPGITGWAQVNGWRGETDTLEKMERRIEHDLEYIRNWDLLWDLQIIMKTIFSRSARKNAY